MDKVDERQDFRVVEGHHPRKEQDQGGSPRPVVSHLDMRRHHLGPTGRVGTTGVTPVGSRRHKKGGTIS